MRRLDVFDGQVAGAFVEELDAGVEEGADVAVPVAGFSQDAEDGAADSGEVGFAGLEKGNGELDVGKKEINMEEDKHNLLVEVICAADSQPLVRPPRVNFGSCFHRSLVGRRCCLVVVSHVILGG